MKNPEIPDHYVHPEKMECRIQCGVIDIEAELDSELINATLRMGYIRIGCVSGGAASFTAS